MEPHSHLPRLSQTWIESPLYFITTCTDQRAPILNTFAIAEILITEWRSAADRYGWVVGRYVIMPDHVHFFARPQPNSKTLSAFVGSWKQWTSKRMKRLIVGRPLSALSERGYRNELALREFVTLVESGGKVWQREFFDHVLRSSESYSAKWTYVRENSVRAGLAKNADDWSFQGEIGILEVHE